LFTAAPLVTSEATIVGTVFNDANANGAADPGEPAFSGLPVTVEDSSSMVVGSATTDTAGNYTIAGLPTDEELTVSVANSGWGALYVDSDGSFASDNVQTVDYSGAGAYSLPFAEYRTLPAPSGLTAAAPSGSEVDLSWTSNSAGAETGFHVYEAVNGGAFSCVAMPTLTHVNITGLSSANDYVFAVAAYDSNGDSARSNTADAAAPPAPTNVTATANLSPGGVASVTLSWTAGDGTPSGTTYSVYKNGNSALPATPYATGLTATSYTDYAVAPGGIYYYFVQAVAASGLGSGAVPVSVVVPLTRPSGGILGSGLSSNAGGSVTVPNTPGTEYLWIGVSVTAQALNSMDGVGTSTVIIPGFDTDLGTEATSRMYLSYTDSGLVFNADSVNAAAYACAFYYGADNSGLDGFGLNASPPQTEGGHNRTYFGLDLGSVPDSDTLPLTAHISSGGPSDTNTCQILLTGFLEVVYTYT
jgi:hypothetical protein